MHSSSHIKYLFLKGFYCLRYKHAGTHMIFYVVSHSLKKILIIFSKSNKSNKVGCHDAICMYIKYCKVSSTQTKLTAKMDGS